MSDRETGRAVGHSTGRTDAWAKLTGSAEFPTDLDRPDALHAGVVRSHRPHARITAVDTAAAERIDGVHAVCSRMDLLGGFGDRVRHHGDVVAAVAGETREAVAAGVEAVDYDLEPLDAVFDPAESVQSGAPVLHEGTPAYGQPVRHPRSVDNPQYEQNVDDYHNLAVGDVDAGFDRADHVLEATYESPRVNHCNLDRHCCIAEFDGDTLEVTATIGNRTHTEHALERLFDGRFDVEILTPPHAGSSFGGHSIETLTLEPVAATLAHVTDRPVRLAFDREEEFSAGDSRHPTTITLRAGITEDGDVTALDVDVVADTGAYPNAVGHIVLNNCKDRPLDLYDLENYRFEGVAAYTNNTPSGEYRGIGVTQITWALECHLDELARTAGVDPVELRRRNWVETGHERPQTGQEITSCGLTECLDRGRATFRDHAEADDDWLYGEGMASGAHATTPASTHNTDFTEAELRVDPDGRVTARVGAVELGQGATTALAQIVAEATGVDLDRVSVESTTREDDVADKYGSVASRTTYLMGRALVDAADGLTERLRELAADESTSPSDLTVEDGRVQGEDVSTPFEELVSAPVSATGRAETDLAPMSFGVHFAAVAVDPVTGAIDIRTYVAAQDVGYAINPEMVAGQLYGAVQHGVEFATLSELDLDRGVPLNANLADYPVSSPHEMPDSMHVELVESNEASGPYGAKGVGTPSIPPVAPAIHNAIRDAVGTRFTTAPVDDEMRFFATGDDDE